MDAEKDLFDGNGGLPGFLFVEDRQADGAGRVDVRVEERWGEFAWKVVSQNDSLCTGLLMVKLRTLRRLRRVFCEDR